MIVAPQFLGIANADGKVELQSITCRSEDSDYVVLNTLDSVGAIVKTYIWINYGGDDSNELCWVDPDTYQKPKEDVFFEPGEGLWVEGDSTENQVTFPGVELK